jgi:LPXTG-site transpeptidase (sortase) family protein
MSRKGYIVLGLALAGIILIAIVALAAGPAKPVEPSNLVFEKGAQLTAVAAPVTPLPIGPAEPTPQPTSSPVVVPARPTATVPPTTAAAITTAVAEATAAAPTTTPTPGPKPANFLIPAKIKIPAINIDTYVERVGVTSDGLMDVPKNIWNTAWFGNGGYRPGDAGNSVIAGHLDAPGTKAVFWDLDKLKTGDKVILTDPAGKQLTFEVLEKQVYIYNNAPLQKIFGPSDEARLNLITCGGTFDRASQNYNQRLVVFTRLMPPA